MSSGFKPEIALPSKFTKAKSLIWAGSTFTGSVKTTPSNTHSGSRLPKTVEVPRILNFGAAPTCPEFCIKIIPGIRPSNIWSIVFTPDTFISSILIVCTALVNFRLSIFWYPVLTITSSNCSADSFRTTWIESCPVYRTSCVSIPINEKSNDTFCILGSVNENLPFTSVDVPKVKPFTITVTPGRGCFFSSVTLPTMRTSFSPSFTSPGTIIITPCSIR